MAYNKMLIIFTSISVCWHVKIVGTCFLGCLITMPMGTKVAVAVGNSDLSDKTKRETKNYCESQKQSSNTPTTSADPRGTASLFSRGIFWWLIPLVILSVRRTLQHSNLYPNPPEIDSERLLNHFNSYWEKEKKRQSPRLWLALFHTVLSRIIIQHITHFILFVAALSGSVLLGFLTEYITNANEETQISPYIPYVYAIALSFCSFISLAMGNLTFHNGWMIGLRIKIILTGAIFQKILYLSQSTVGEITIGHVINLASNDTRLIDDAFYVLSSLLLYPFFLVAATAIMYYTIGVYAFLAIGVTVTFILLQVMLTKLYHNLRLKSLRMSDSRIKIMSEVLSSIRVIKMYTWEYPFKNMVDKIRKKEIYILTKAAIIHACHLSLYTNLYAVTLFITFTSIALSPSPAPFSPQQIFTTVAVISYVRRETVLVFMFQLMKISDFSVAMKRIQALLCEDELATQRFTTAESAHLLSKKKSQQNDLFISLENVSTSWSNGSNMVLLDVSCTLSKERPLMAVVGPVGAGKSSLLQCILKELPVLKGHMTVRGSVAYVSQESWLFSDTLRENILFGMPYRSDWYNTVVNLCALDTDINILLNGDQTLIGERGVTLSGGQKARVTLARAIYRDADIYLLDDPLSAVDAAVSRLIFHRCIKGHLRKQGKLVVLVTHQVQYVTECDTILALKNGKMTTHDQLTVVENSEKMTDGTTCTGVNSISEHNISLQEPQQATQKIDEEDSAQGGVSLSTYYHYFNIGGGYIFTVFVFVFYLSVEASVVTTDWWLTKHVSNNDSNWLIVYGGLTGAVVLLSFIRTFLFFILLLRASYLLHNKLFAAVLRAPVFFFDNNPVGRVLNRFSKDIGYIDDQLQISCIQTLMIFSFLSGILALAVASNPFILIAVIVLGAVFIVVRWLYVCGTRNFKRLEALARSPIFSQLSTTLQGLPVIRSYSMQSVVMNQFHCYQNRNSQAWYLFICTIRWGVIWNDVICTSFLMIFALISIPLATSFDGALLSLALTYTVTISDQAFGYIMWSSGDVESYMISTERVLAYTRLEPEAPLETNTSKPPPDWPNKGHIELRNVEYKHSSTGPLVLKDISLAIMASEKIGIVGRTGAGKSSLIAALFRLAEPTGSIKIDGVECLDLGLHDVRSKISIIPQEPVLFSGTVRYNLDPFEQYNDHSIWTILEYVQLKDLILGMEGKLKAIVSEGGSNFSVGQKQLFCLARALLRDNRILILDEATANVDVETDAIIQRVIRDHFSHCTVLAIAHRLDTVMDYDKIMVLDNGKVCEYGVPCELMGNPKSLLLKLVESTGPLTAERLKNIALKNVATTQ